MKKNFKNFKIYIDYSYIIYQANLDFELSKNAKKVINAMVKAK